MSGRTYKSLRTLVERLRVVLDQQETQSQKTVVNQPATVVLLFAYNRTGKTRLSMEFRDAGKRKSKRNPEGDADTLYFNAFTEDLFTWENDLPNDTDRHLRINLDSHFFDAPKQLDLNADIEKYLTRYVDFKFDISFEEGTVRFSRDVVERVRGEEKLVTKSNIKISRGEENIFTWCLFMAIAERLADNDVSYSWVKYLYIDDPISSLDDNNAISVACDLAGLLRRVASRKDENGDPDPIKVVLSSHHALFFNVMCNEIGRPKEGEPDVKHKRFFLHRPNGDGVYTLRGMNEDTPYFHHVATLAELQKAATSGTLYTFHFNALRSIMEKTASFFGHKDISFCLKKLDNEDNRALFNRALNLLSHGKYEIFAPREMIENNKDLFRQILADFIAEFHFALPDILGESRT